ncbi:MAG: glycosyltransferase family 4 protein [Bacteroidota bacterium]|nr:glycosyltransferase family 4 protein [Bacteroidota bacterium]MDP4215988.1 glycosyltransferase family 4 protein [Bacteroidota bacterium]MDP4245089.1 glycosyltransferase family 4 protein [Bacteroidota bacterium]MDP4252541.1 glycosyltransferase family 4 protein [Bacteroidota bacterium]MDP4257823.1 glycosyltransferase family 4 protein [Bacteroidota bacterium]
MKFVFVSHNYSPDIHSPGDWFARIKIYTGSLSCLSERHSVIRIERINYTGSCLHEGVQYYFGDYGKGKLHWPWALHRFVAALHPDVVVVSGLHYPWQVIQLRWRLGNEVVIIAQNHAEKPFTGIRKLLQRMADRCIDAYFFSSKEMGSDWVDRGNLADRRKIHEVMEVSSVFHPSDREMARSTTGVQGQPVWLWVGRLDQNKNPLMVLRAFLQYARVRPGPRLYMIFHTTELLGEIERLLEGERADGKDGDREQGDRREVILVGAQDHGRLQDWYSSADFIVSGSWYEGSGAAVCEAMSCGCIPILTDIPSFRMMTGHGRCGRLYAAGDQQGLLAALMATSDMDIASERRKTLEQFRSKLSFEAIAAGMEEVAISLRNHGPA